VGWQEVHGDITGLRLALEVTKSRLHAPGATATLLLRYPRPYATAEVVAYPAVWDSSRSDGAAQAAARSGYARSNSLRPGEGEDLPRPVRTSA
jgi:hypothetical protein